MGKQMAGPGIRYFHMARTLSLHVSVTLALALADERHADADLAHLQAQLPNARLLPYRPGEWGDVMAAAASAQVIVLASDLVYIMPPLTGSQAALVIDGYDPLLAEWLSMEVPRGHAEMIPWWQSRMRQLQPQYLAGDFYICASERQRDWWLGLLEANGRINPWTFGQDPSLRRLVDVVAYGLPDEEPEHTRSVIKGVWPGIQPEDKLILWGGGLWQWLDPLTAIRAVAKIWPQRQDVRLIFPGTKHPNPIHAQIPNHVAAAKELAASLGLLDRAIFFGDWIDYADWVNVLLEADVAISLHFETLETRLSSRTRILEYMWAGLPTVATQGDVVGTVAAGYGLAALVPTQDADAVAAAILDSLDAPQAGYTQPAQLARQDLAWSQVLRPLIDFCKDPHMAPDRGPLIEKIGPPYFSETWATQEIRLSEAEGRNIDLSAENQSLRALIGQYEQGRFMRLMRGIHQVRQRWFR